jgi:predicted Fe-S protein YdhL (DUF1289 family)
MIVTCGGEPGAPELNAISSPCILICSIDMNTGYCFGCGRTREEIAGWMTYSEEERARIMAFLGKRLEKVERRPKRMTRRRRMAQARASGGTND